MSLSRIPPHLADRVRVILAGPGEMRILLECAMCEELLVWQQGMEKWYCQECEVSTSPLELSGLFQDCLDALGAPARNLEPSPTPKAECSEGLGERWRRKLLEEIQRRLQKDD